MNNNRRLRSSSSLQGRRAQRLKAERRFKLLGLGSTMLAMCALVFLLVTVSSKGINAFRQNVVHLEIDFDPERLGVGATRDPEVIAGGNYRAILKNALSKIFPDVFERREKRKLFRLLSDGASYELRDELVLHPEWIGTTLRLPFPLSDEADMFIKGSISRDVPESDRRISDMEIYWLDHLVESGRVESIFNWRFFSSGDSREPELAGLRGALVGSFWALTITLLLSFPVGVAAAIYLEEFSRKSRFNDFIDVNINNLAAVPSIVFGLLGLAVFLNFFGLPRSAPLVGGMVLALMTLPTIIIASRSAIAAVPPSIKEAAIGMGASSLQVVTHHVIPLALPGMLTGTIIGMARALGETAPLLMIGMVAFVVDIPEGPLSASTALPVQIFLWADSPERAFVEKTSAAILVLLAFLIVMNLAAIVLRGRFERRW